jgi:ribonuclease Z
MLAKTTSLAFGGRHEKTEESGKSRDGCSFTLIGRSRAGEGTCWAIPELKWMFDCGALIQGWKPKRIFLSHTHSDHVHHLVHMSDIKHPPVVILPSRAAPLVKAHLQAHHEMIECMTTVTANESSQNIQLAPAEPGEEIFIRQSGSEYVCRTVACDHRIDCLGFSIFRIKNLLKEEYAGLPRQEIAQLRKEGVEITKSTEEPFLCVLGDTTEVVFERYPLLLRIHMIVVVECTFVDDASLGRAEDTKHMHWLSLRPFVEAHPGTLFVLTHFSLKYSSLELRMFFYEHSPQHNVHPMLIESEVENDWIKTGAEGTAPSCNCRECSR